MCFVCCVLCYCLNAVFAVCSNLDCSVFVLFVEALHVCFFVCCFCRCAFCYFFGGGVASKKLFSQCPVGLFLTSFDSLRKKYPFQIGRY